MPGTASAQALPAATEEKLLKRWLSAAESQICALEVLCSQIPKVNRLLEDNMIAVGGNFNKLAAEVQKLPDGEIKSSMQAEVMKAIVGMQFQDRVSQNLVITEKVSRGIVSYLTTVIAETIVDLRLEGKATLDMAFAEQMASFLTLGELQHQFVDHLITHGYIKDGAQIGAVTSSAAAHASGDVDLF